MFRPKLIRPRPGLPPTQYHLIERAQRSPLTQAAMCQALGVSASILRGELLGQRAMPPERLAALRLLLGRP